MDEILKDVDLYDLLGVLQSASLDEIKSAYRKKALKCHPDKNPDNPKAGELFHQLSKALEVLLDSSARAAYNNVINAKKAAKLRHQALDSRRKKFKEELEAREKEAELSSRLGGRVPSSKTDEEKLQAEIERLRKEGSKQLHEEIEHVKQQVLEEQRNLASSVPTQKRLKVRWKSSKDDETNGGYNSENLDKMFSKYGDIEALAVSSKKKGSALIEFVTSDAADKAQKYERGLPSNPFTVDWLEKPLSSASMSNKAYVFNNLEPNQRIFPSYLSKTIENNTSSPERVVPTVSKTGCNFDYESLVLRQMRQAEERKRLIEEINKDNT
ncbi:dnaJ homolog subfamily C member 17 [Lycorma delicatula]|uniref:dnaJ homolog subfamily C member 17 n=1 Tax=Lycorma delicatula TaxID=130591 RepID=UPI003F519E80